MKIEIEPCGTPLSCGWWEGQPVWFDNWGLPHNLADVRQALDQTEARRLELETALAQVEKDRAVRQAIADRLTELETRAALIARVHARAARGE